MLGYDGPNCHITAPSSPRTPTKVTYRGGARSRVARVRWRSSLEFLQK